MKTAKEWQSATTPKYAVYPRPWGRCAKVATNFLKIPRTRRAGRMQHMAVNQRGEIIAMGAVGST